MAHMFRVNKKFPRHPVHPLLDVMRLYCVGTGFCFSCTYTKVVIYRLTSKWRIKIFYRSEDEGKEFIHQFGCCKV